MPQKRITDYFDVIRKKWKQKILTDFYCKLLLNGCTIPFNESNESISRIRKCLRSREQWFKKKRHNNHLRTKLRFFREQTLNTRTLWQKRVGSILYTSDLNNLEINAHDILRQRTNIGVAALSHNELCLLEVAPNYHGQGIATNMIRFLNKLSDNKLTTYCDPSHLSRYSLTHGGLAVIQKCIKKGYLSDTQLIWGDVPSSPQYSQSL